MARVWMNHWFSTAYNIISLMRDAIPEIEMVGSNEHLYSPIMNVCDEWYQEPVLKVSPFVLISAGSMTLICLCRGGRWCRSVDTRIVLPAPGLRLW